jgi:phage replication-related protein YjqB (UPF0714/DUF867 family)
LKYLLFIFLLVGCATYQGQWGRNKSFHHLQKNNVEGRDYIIKTRLVPGKPMVMAIHGGRIEVGTSELLQAIVKSDFSYYELEAKSAPDFDESILQSGYMHLTSHRFDDPKLIEMASQSNKCLSLHGYPAKKTEIDFCVGGANEALRKQVVDLLKQNFPNYSTCELCCPPYLGLHKNNVVNKCQDQGAQIEFSPKVRRLIYSQESLGSQPLKEKIAAILRQALL